MPCQKASQHMQQRTRLHNAQLRICPCLPAGMLKVMQTLSLQSKQHIFSGNLVSRSYTGVHWKVLLTRFSFFRLEHEVEFTHIQSRVLGQTCAARTKAFEHRSTPSQDNVAEEVPGQKYRYMFAACFLQKEKGPETFASRNHTSG